VGVLDGKVAMVTGAGAALGARPLWRSQPRGLMSW
jgi:hypothetical protein